MRPSKVFSWAGQLWNRLNRIWRAVSIVIVVIAVIAVGLAIREANKAESCNVDHATCQVEVIQRVRALPDDAERIAQAVLAIYGPAVQVAEQRKDGTGPGLASNLKTGYEYLVDGLRSGQAKPTCVRDGLVDLLASDNMNSARASVVSASFDATGKISGILPGPGKALEEYFSVIKYIPESAMYIAVTYDLYKSFPYQDFSIC